MSKCTYCNCSVFDRPLHRINEKGVNALWACMPCIEKEEPELANNIKEDNSDGVIEDLTEICYPLKK